MKYEPLIADKYYHIYNRGNNREDIFLQERNFPYFLSLIQKYILPVAEIYAYCLLKNHFHLLIKTKEIEDDKLISRAFSNLFNAYSKAINMAFNRTGSLFQDRFKRKIIEDEDYLKTLILYIHLNPQNHKMIEDFSFYKHSSYQSILSRQPTFLSREEVLGLFDNPTNLADVHFQRRDEILNNSLDLTGLEDL